MHLSDLKIGNKVKLSIVTSKLTLKMTRGDAELSGREVFDCSFFRFPSASARTIVKTKNRTYLDLRPVLCPFVLFHGSSIKRGQLTYLRAKQDVHLARVVYSLRAKY